jgi:hypothetical protein
MLKLRFGFQPSLAKVLNEIAEIWFGIDFTKLCHNPRMSVDPEKGRVLTIGGIAALTCRPAWSSNFVALRYFLSGLFDISEHALEITLSHYRISLPTAS